MTVLHFPPPALHVLHGEDEPCCNADNGDYCFICNGGLACCNVCGGAEGSMPTDCPGYEMPSEVAEAVYAGEVDYSRREGWVQRSSVLGAFIKRDSDAVRALRDEDRS